MKWDEIAKIKEDILAQKDNCGGCETCSQVFGDKELTYDPRTVFELILYIEEQEKVIKELCHEI